MLANYDMRETESPHGASEPHSEYYFADLESQPLLSGEETAGASSASTERVQGAPRSRPSTSTSPGASRVVTTASIAESSQFENRRIAWFFLTAAMVELTLLFAFVFTIDIKQFKLPVGGLESIGTLGLMTYGTKCYFLLIVLRDSNFYACMILSRTGLDYLLQYHLIALMVDSVVICAIASYCVAHATNLTGYVASGSQDEIDFDDGFGGQSSNQTAQMAEMLRSFFLLLMNCFSQIIVYVHFRPKDSEWDDEEAILDQAALSLPRLTRREIARIVTDQLKTETFERVIEARGGKECVVAGCCICLTDFVDQDRITVLECDERHIFHEDCITMSFEVKLACPICRKPALSLSSTTASSNSEAASSSHTVQEPSA